MFGRYHRQLIEDWLN